MIQKKVPAWLIGLRLLGILCGIIFVVAVIALVVEEVQEKPERAQIKQQMNAAGWDDFSIEDAAGVVAVKVGACSTVLLYVHSDGVYYAPNIRYEYNSKVSGTYKDDGPSTGPITSKFFEGDLGELQLSHCKPDPKE